MQNRSHAIMSQRVEPKNSSDDFPTPPWATRALIEYVIGANGLNELTCLEPACGRGYMVKVLNDYFGHVIYSDAYDYNYATVQDYLTSNLIENSVDWVITNPPFRLAEEFVFRSLKIARHGVAMLVRSVFLESVGRYNRLFQHTPPSKFAQFVERVPMVKGRLDKDASTATSYAWLVWDQKSSESTKVIWIPPCRRSFERPDDYQDKQLILI